MRFAPLPPGKVYLCRSMDGPVHLLRIHNQNMEACSSAPTAFAGGRGGNSKIPTCARIRLDVQKQHGRPSIDKSLHRIPLSTKVLNLEFHSHDILHVGILPRHVSPKCPRARGVSRRRWRSSRRFPQCGRASCSSSAPLWPSTPTRRRKPTS